MEIMGPPSGWYDPPEHHKDICNCENCHQSHIENGDFAKLAASGPDFQCCKDELDSRIEKGLWCKSHGDAYMDKQVCWECWYQMPLDIRLLHRAVGE